MAYIAAPNPTRQVSYRWTLGPPLSLFVPSVLCWVLVTPPAALAQAPLQVAYLPDGGFSLDTIAHTPTERW